MKVFAILLSSALASVAVNLQTINGNFINPLSWCGEESASLSLTDVVLTPYPVVAGQDLSVKVIGKLRENVTAGAVAHISGKLGFIPVFKTDLDLCSQIDCPLGKDDLNDQSITIKQPVTALAPRGKLGITIKVDNGDGSEIACLQGKLEVVKAGDSNAQL